MRILISGLRCVLLYNFFIKPILWIYKLRPVFSSGSNYCLKRSHSPATSIIAFNPEGLRQAPQAGHSLPYLGQTPALVVVRETQMFGCLGQQPSCYCLGWNWGVYYWRLRVVRFSHLSKRRGGELKENLNYEFIILEMSI